MGGSRLRGGAGPRGLGYYQPGDVAAALNSLRVNKDLDCAEMGRRKPARTSWAQKPPPTAEIRLASGYLLPSRGSCQSRLQGPDPRPTPGRAPLPKGPRGSHPRDLWAWPARMLGLVFFWHSFILPE